MNLGSDEPVGLTKAGLALLDRPTYAVIARPPARGGPRRAARHPVAAPARAHRGRRGAHRQGAARRAAHARARRPRDDRQLAGLDLGAARPHPGRLRRACASAVRADDDAEAVIEATIVEGMRSRPVIPIIGRRVTVPWRLGRLRGARPHAGDDEHPAGAPSRGPLSASRSPSGRSAGWAASPAPTSGSRSAAASAAAWARRWRWPSSAWCSRRWRGGSTSRRRTPSPSTPCTAT